MAVDAAGSLLPAGTPCAVHAAAEAVFVCARCGSFGCAACLATPAPGGGVCHGCAARGLEGGVPWERWRQVGLLRAWWDTTRYALRSPTRLFRSPPHANGTVASLGYGLVSYTVGQLGYALFLALLMVGMGGLSAAAIEGAERDFLLGYFGCMGAAVVPLMLVFAPFQGLIGALFAAVGAHAALALTRAPRAGFEQSLRAVSYANAAYVAYAVPCLGPLIALVWVPVLEAIGLREVHGVSTGRAAFAAVGWRVALLLVIAAGYALFFAFFAAALSHETGGASTGGTRPFP
ncbi:MAG: hypothetical protein ACODAU_01375 [Myxococcota bacterium]